MLDALLPVGDRVERAAVQQRSDGSIRIVAHSEESLAAMRFTLGIDADHGEFLRRFRHDDMLGPATQALAGLRQLRLGTAAHALLRALCGQLIESSRARFLERTIVRAVMPSSGGLHAPPTAAALGAVAPAELRRLGLHARRGTTLVRVCGSLDLDRLRDCPAETVASRLGQSAASARGPSASSPSRVWDGTTSASSATWGSSSSSRWLRGRRVEGWETEELLAPYEDWAGLASVYLLNAWGRGLLPVSPAARFAA